MRRILLSLITTCAVFCVEAVGAAEDPRALQLTYEPWTRTCLGESGSKLSCFVAAGARGACYPSGGSISISKLAGEPESLFAGFGTKHRLQGPISIRIDQDPPIIISKMECTVLSCGGRFEIDSGLVERLKRSQTITIEAVDEADKKLSLSLSLADFVKAYDGPAIRPPKMRELIRTSEEIEAMIKQAEEEKKLRECKE